MSETERVLAYLSTAEAAKALTWSTLAADNDVGSITLQPSGFAGATYFTGLGVQFHTPSRIGWDWHKYIGNYMALLLWETVGALGFSPHVPEVLGLCDVMFPTDVLRREDFVLQKDDDPTTAVLKAVIACSGKTYEDLLQYAPTADVSAC